MTPWNGTSPPASPAGRLAAQYVDVAVAAADGARAGAATRSPPPQPHGPGLRRGGRAPHCRGGDGFSTPSPRTERSPLSAPSQSSLRSRSASGAPPAGADRRQPVAYMVSGTTATGTLEVPSTGTAAVLTVKGLQTAPRHRGLRGLAHPDAGLTQGCRVPEPGSARRGLDGGRARQHHGVHEHCRNGGARRREPGPLEHRGAERSAQRVLTRAAAPPSAASPRPRGEHA